MKPEYTRCRAKVGGGQCTNEITYDAEGDFWSNFCADHNEADNKARVSGEPRVEKFTEDEIQEKQSDEDE